MNKTLMTVALLAALGLVAYVTIIQPAAAPVAAAPASDADQDGDWYDPLIAGFGAWLGGGGPAGPDVGPAWTAA